MAYIWRTLFDEETISMLFPSGLSRGLSCTQIEKETNWVILPDPVYIPEPESNWLLVSEPITLSLEDQV